MMNKNTDVPSSLESMQEWINTNRPLWLKELMTFLSFPSISSELQFKQSTLDCAQWLSEYLHHLQFKVELWPTDGHPILFASNMQAGPTQPTLLIYHHYDVQPVDPLEEWETHPFEPNIRDGRSMLEEPKITKGNAFTYCKL